MKAADLADRVAQDLAEVERLHREHFDTVHTEFRRAGEGMDAEVEALREVLQELIVADRFLRRLGRRIRDSCRRGDVSSPRIALSKRSRLSRSGEKQARSKSGTTGSSVFRL